MLKILVTACVAVFACLVLGSAPASAHAALVRIDPGDGARLGAAPAKVALEFNENVATPAFVVITAPDGSRVRTGKVTILDKTVTVTVAPVDMKGTYLMSYRVVSADGHPVEGSTTFDVTIGRTVTEVAPAEQQSFAHRHQGHLLWGLAGAVVAIGLLLWPLWRKRE